LALAVCLFFISNHWRVILGACSLIGTLLFPNVIRVPAAPAEASVISTLGQLAQSVETYRKEHPNQGYPATPPSFSSGNYSVERYFEFRYLTSRSKPDGPTDGFLIQVLPVWRQCGFVRSFTAVNGGQIYFTLEERPATTTDKPLSPGFPFLSGEAAR